MTARLGPATQLLIASFLVLFQELMLIRWLPSQVRVLAYFPNVVLISAFLGLGLGALMAKRKAFIQLWPLTLLITVAFALVLSRIAFTHESTSEFLFLLYYDLPRNAPVIPTIGVPIILMFVLSAVSFIPLGQFVAQRLQHFGEQSRALWGYCWDLTGSLIGVVVFAYVSWRGFFPVVWFSLAMLCGLLILWYRIGSLRHLGTMLICCGLILGLVVFGERAQVYSPYYALSVESDASIVRVLANGSLHQRGMMLRRDDPELPEQNGYHLPYDLVDTPRTALVLGAGTGNDVAVLLDRGVAHIDAVEIDPEILAIGRRSHPNQPYSSDRVRLHNTDARSYINTCEKTYDMIVFGTLDSMTRLSALSSVRLDNFVYTKDCIAAARTLLNPDGGMVFYFMVGNPFIDRHLRSMINSAFGSWPVVVSAYFRLFNKIYLAGPAFENLDYSQMAYADLVSRDPVEAIEIVPNDNWPYLYLQRPGLSRFYVSVITVLIFISLAGVLWVSKEMRRDFFSKRRWDLEMLLFGAAFLLIETKLVTEMSLIWGATWITSAVVFGSILVMILLATILTQIKPPALWLSFAGLIISLAITYIVPVRVLLVDNTPLRLLGSLLFAGVPIFFAAICFAARFKIRENSGIAFGWNLLGAVLGGLFEFTSMLFGIKALTLFAILFYLLIVVKLVVGTNRLQSAATTP